MDELRYCPRCKNENEFHPKAKICITCEHEHKMLQAHADKKFNQQTVTTPSRLGYYHTQRVVKYGEAVTAILEKDYEHD